MNVNTREMIIRKALNLFMVKGYKDVSLNDIVKEVGLTKGAFYHHFSSKEELFRVILDLYLIEQGENSFNDLPKENLWQFMTSYLEKFSMIVNNLVSEMSNSATGVSFLNMAFDAMKLLPDFSEKVSRVHQIERNVWVEVIRNAKKRGEITTTINDLQLAKMFVAINDGIGIHLMLENKYFEMHGHIFNQWSNLYHLIKTK